MDRSVLKETVQDFKKEVDDLEKILNPEEVEKKIKELDKAPSDPSFWTDQKHAQTIINESNDLRDKLSSLNQLKSDLESLEMIFDVSKEDPESLNEADKIVDSFNEKFHSFSNELLLGEDEDKDNAIIEIHSGAGGTESLDWVSMLFRMYQMYAQKKHMKFTTLFFEAGDEAGIKDVVFKVDGKYAYGFLKGESGVHRLVRLSPFDSSHSRHTTFASVLVTPEINDDISVEIKDEDIRVDIYHSSGAGGQGVNTTYSAVRITHLPTGLVVTCQNERSQIQNKATALSVLKSRLYQLEMDKRREEMDKLSNKPRISFGSQIRSYVFHPYTLVKDHRTGFETSQGQKVMDGDLDGFIDAYLKMKGKENV